MLKKFYETPTYISDKIYDDRYFVVKKIIETKLYHPILDELLTFKLYFCNLILANKNKTDGDTYISRLQISKKITNTDFDFSSFIPEFKKYNYCYEELLENDKNKPHFLPKAYSIITEDLTKELNKHIYDKKTQRTYFYAECYNSKGEKLPDHYSILFYRPKNHYQYNILTNLEKGEVLDLSYEKIEKNIERLKYFDDDIKSIANYYLRCSEEFKRLFEELDMVLSFFSYNSNLLFLNNNDESFKRHLSLNQPNDFFEHHRTLELKYKNIYGAYIESILNSYEDELIKIGFKRCKNEKCRRIFIDETKKNSKEYCNEKCRRYMENQRYNALKKIKQANENNI